MEFTYRKIMKLHDQDIKKDKAHPFFTTSLKHLNVDIEIASGSVENIPKDEAIVVVANHPFGIVDGLILNQLMHDRRPEEYTILTNQVLLKAERMVPYLTPIDDTETPEGMAINKKSIFHAMRMLKNNEAVCVFPAGRLARPRGWSEPFEDLEWQELTSHFVTKVKSRATGKAPKIIPIFFEGENSGLFRLAALLGWFTITRSLVINECRNKQNSAIQVHIGAPIEPEDVPEGLTPIEISAWMREQTLALGKKS